MTTTRQEFDETRFRRSAAAVLTSLADDDLEILANGGETTGTVLDLMVKRGEAAQGFLTRRGRTLTDDQYDVLAAAVLSVRPKIGVQQNLSHIVDAFDQLVDHGVSADLAVACRVLRREGLVGLLTTTARVSSSVDAPGTPPMFVTMTTAAVLAAEGTALPDAPKRIEEVLVRANELAAVHRAYLASAEGPGHHFPVLGNTDLVGQIAAYRVAVDELTGQPAPPFPEVAAQVTTYLRRGLTRAPGAAFWHGRDPDVVITFQQFAKTIGGEAAAEVFRCLHRDLTFFTMGKTRNLLTEDIETLVDERIVAGTHRPMAVESSVLTADTAARQLVDVLYTGAGARCNLITEWLLGKRKQDSQVELAFLVDRVRRVAHRLGAAPEAPSLQPELVSYLPLLAPRVRDALALGASGTEIAALALPPLWTRRSAAVKLVQSKIRAHMKRGVSSGTRAALVSAVVVRGPSQLVSNVAPARTTVCPCGARGARRLMHAVPVHPEEACPHRQWSDHGVVEDYSTLAMANDLLPDTVRMQLRRYAGPWERWVEEVSSATRLRRRTSS